MTAERIPHADSLLARPLVGLTRWAIRQPIVTLSAAVALAALSLTYAGTSLGWHDGRGDLLNPSDSYHQRWLEYAAEFGDQDDTVIVVEGPGPRQITPVVDELAQALLSDERLFHNVLWRTDAAALHSKGLHYLPRDELLEIQASLDQLPAVLRGDWSQLTVGRMTAALCAKMRDIETVSHARGAGAAAPEAQLSRLADSLALALARNGAYQSPWPTLPGAQRAAVGSRGSDYLFSADGRLGLVVLHLNSDSENRTRGEALDALRGIIASAKERHPHVQIGLTGLPVLEHDEMQAGMAFMTQATWYSLAGVAVLFLAALGGWRHGALAMAALLIGLAWTLGFASMAVGHLNILSLSLGALLSGLGIDFGIHYVLRYLEIREQGRNVAAAVVETAASVGPGLVLGAATTAAAFFCAAVTDFRGVAELGRIAGGGILLCLLAALVLLPAMLLLCDGAARPLPRPLDPSPLVARLTRRRARSIVLAGAGLVTLLTAAGLIRLRYDHNLLNLQQPGLESVALEQRLLTQQRGMWFALSIADNEQDALRLKAAFLRLPSVQRVEELASLLPTDGENKQDLIEPIQRRLEELPERTPRIPLDRPAELAQALSEASDLALWRLPNSPCGPKLAYVRRLLAQLPVQQAQQRLAAFQQRLAEDLLARLRAVQAMAHPEPPSLEDLPQALVARFVGKNERYLLRVHSRGSVWDMAALEAFVQDVRSVDPQATGHPLQAYEASRQMKRSYEAAGIYALLAIVLLLLLDFRRIADTLWALLPLALGVVPMFGLMGWLNAPLNPANIVVLPLILGIGIDNGVHIIHDFRRQPAGYRISPSTALGVVLTSLTTMVGMGMLMFSEHRGLQSLGRALTLGVACCLAGALLVLPAALAWWEEWTGRRTMALVLSRDCVAEHSTDG
jgi:hypothetical protein